MRHVPQSPYARALGERANQLHPTLQRYFSAIPEGYLGIGEGTFTRVGTRRRWLRPLLRPFQRRSVVFAGWKENVPFRITNRLVAGRALSERHFLLPGGTWTMRDAVLATPHGHVVDELGGPATVAALFDLTVDNGALTMTSRAIGIRLGRARLRVPARIAPVVRLVERFDDDIQRQRVDVTIDVPLLGRVYEYSGHFSYRIEKDGQ